MVEERIGLFGESGSASRSERKTDVSSSSDRDEEGVVDVVSSRVTVWEEDPERSGRVGLGGRAGGC